MPGRKSQNLRRGDRNEDLGVHLLRQIGFVAEFRRQDDFGLDAFVTLANDDSRGSLIPGDSFVVQIKSFSIRTVMYDNTDAIRWLKQLDIPMFIGSVDPAKNGIEMFATHSVFPPALRDEVTSVHLHLDPISEPSQDPSVRNFFLGSPAASWSIGQIDDGIVQNVLRTHINARKRNLLLAQLGQSEDVHWDKSGARLNGNFSVLGSVQRNDESKRRLATLVPGLRQALMMLGKDSSLEDVVALFAFIAYLRRQGIEPDVGGFLTFMPLMFFESDKVRMEEIIDIRAMPLPGRLYLNNLPVTDDHLSAIPENVEELALQGTKITDEGLPALGRLGRLRKLSVAKTALSDASIETLANFKLLESLNVGDCQISQTGIDRLRAALPAANIILRPV